MKGLLLSRVPLAQLLRSVNPWEHCAWWMHAASENGRHYALIWLAGVCGDVVCCLDGRDTDAGVSGAPSVSKCQWHATTWQQSGHRKQTLAGGIPDPVGTEMMISTGKM